MTGRTHVGFHTSNLNRLWADLIVAELIRSGVRMFCLSPGSRCTPLTTAVAAHPDAPHVVHFDERGSAFFALGFARATGRPAAWITTSGTAVANGMPAVVEASVDGVPLILLTADRPPELRETGANQTIDQVKLFGDFVRWHFDLPTPTASISPEAVLTTVDQAVYRSRRMPCGPVHLNCMFREPLAPHSDGGEYGDYLSPLERWIDDGVRPYTMYVPLCPVPIVDDLDRLTATLRRAERGLVVAGRLASKMQGDAVRWLGERLRWPILADVGSQLRMHEFDASPNVIPSFDAMLVSDSFRFRHAPDAVLQLGGPPTSRRLAGFLAEARPDTYTVIREAPSRLDPHHHVTTHVEADVVMFCRELADRINEQRSIEELIVDEEVGSDWLQSWRSAALTAAGVVKESQAASAVLNEPSVAYVVSRTTQHGLFLASSMPVRDVDSYGSVVGHGPLVASNRGASGIDGTVASAAGFARGLEAPVTLLVGDLALLHDLNSLSLAATSEHPIRIVVVNNRGGGIFSFLPIAQHVDVFETYFGTPHPYSFEHAAALFEISYEAPSTSSELRDVLEEYTETTVLIEVVTDREENVRLHRELEQRIAREVDLRFAVKEE